MSAPATVPPQTRTPVPRLMGTENDASLEGFQIYRRQIPSTRLTSEQVEELSQQIVDARGGNTPKKGISLRERSQETQSVKDAKQKLVEGNLRLVLRAAKRYYCSRIDMMDLIQAGNLGLMHAVEKYDHRLGYAFSTYAIRWICQYMARAIAEWSMITVPLYKLAEIKKLDRVRRSLEDLQATNELTLEDLAKAFEASVEEVIELLAASQEIVSLDRPRGEEDMTLCEMLEDNPADSPERVVERQILSEQLRAELRQLPELERRVIELRYGLNENGFSQKEHTLIETGQKLKKSYEAVRQAELRALAKLERRCQHLKEYLNA